LKFSDYSGNNGQLSIATGIGYYSPVSTPGDMVFRAFPNGDIILYSVRGSIRLVTEPRDTYPGELYKHEKMTILPNGNVGIGTAEPIHKLDVDGTIRAKEIIVENDGADFVFEDGYQLMPLDELDQYIKDNRHLPGIPKAESMQANGMSVGEMQTMLLQKIEEFTLYMIELKKENEQLKARVASLESANH
jgi:hypothetical protein